MKTHHGQWSVDPVEIWVKKYGFPDNGSFSLNQLKMVEKGLEEVDKKKRGKKRCV